MKTNKAMLLYVFLCSFFTLFPFLTAEASVSVDHIQWREDQGEKSQKVFYEKWASGVIEESKNPGTLQIFLHNEGDDGIGISDISLNGAGIDKYWYENKIVWHQLTPLSMSDNSYAMLAVRFRNKPEKEDVFEITMTDGSVLLVNISEMEVPDFRIERVGFAKSGKSVIVYFRQFDGTNNKLDHVYINGLDNYKKKWISRDFFNSYAAVEIFPKNQLKTGDYIYIKADTDKDQTTGFVIRVVDNFYPLGVFDRPYKVDFARLAKAGMNTVMYHYNLTKSLVTKAMELEMKSICSYATWADEDENRDKENNPILSFEGQPPSDLCNSPGVFAWTPMDEIESLDWFRYHHNKKHECITGIANDQQVGFPYAQVSVQSHMNFRKFDTLTPLGTFNNGTYKPHASYVYAQLSDYYFRDDYEGLGKDGSLALSPEDILKREEISTLAANPIPTIHVFRNLYGNHGFRIGRPVTESEQRRLILYPVAAGAKGLIGWWNVTKNAAQNFPAQWYAHSRAFRTLQPILELLDVGCPMDIVQCDNPKTWAKLISTGSEACIMIVANTDYAYTKDYSKQTKINNVRFTMPYLPWMEINTVVKLDENGYKAVKFSNNKKDSTTNITLDSLVDVEVLLLSSDKGLPKRLWDAERERQSRIGLALYDVERQKITTSGQIDNIINDVKLNRKNNVIVAKNKGGISDNNVWNPLAEDKPCVRWWRPKNSEPINYVAVEWSIDVEDVGTHTFLINSVESYPPDIFRIRDANGTNIKAEINILTELIGDTDDMPHNIIALTFHCQKPGKYTCYSEQDTTGGSIGGAVAKCGYFLPGLKLEDVLGNIRK